MALGIVLLLAAFLYRVAVVYAGGIPWNFSPLMALALCGGLFLPRFWAWAVPLGALLASTAAVDLHYHKEFLAPEAVATWLVYAVAIAGGIALRRRPTWPRVLGASVAASFLFYVATNTVSFLVEAGYPKNAGGWLQALTTGLPGYPPTWTFFRNSAASDMLFTAFFLGCMALAKVEVPASKASAPLTA